MKVSPRLWVILGVLLVATLGLIGFFVFLTGGSGETATSGQKAIPVSKGLVPVKSIYAYGNKSVERPVGLGGDEKGFFVTMLDRCAVVEFDVNGGLLRSWGKRGSVAGSFLAPVAVDVDRAAGHVYVVDRARLRLIAFDLKGAFLWEVPILNPVSVTVADNGDVIVGTFGPVARFSSEGELLGQSGSRGPDAGQFDYPRALTAVGDSIVVADTNNNRVERVRLDGDATATVEWVIGTRALGQDDPNTRWGLPTGITSATSGGIVVLDSFRHTIELLDAANGHQISDFGGERRGSDPGHFELPTAIEHLKGDTFAVTDTGNNRIQIIRLVAPGARQPWNLFPWTRWLLLLPLLLLLTVFGRKRTLITSAALQRALDDGNARLVLAAVRPGALPETIEAFAGVTEGDVVITEHLRRRSGEGKDELDRIADAGTAKGLSRLLFPRVRVVCADQAECDGMRTRGRTPWAYDDVVEEFEIVK